MSPHWPLPALLIACGGEPSLAQDQQDRVRYQAGIASGAPLLRLDQCRAVQDVTLRGDCLTALAPLAGEIEGLSAEDLCSEVQEESWRDECFFVAAEQAKQEEDLARAAQLCGRAGRFARDCSNHMWQQELRATIFPGGVRTLVQRHDQVQAIHDRWEQAFTEQGDFDKRFWEHCYQVAFERAPFLDIRGCEFVPEAEQEICLHSAETTYRAWLNQALDQGGAKAEFCALAPPSLLPSQVAPVLQTTTVPNHPRLTLVLLDFHAARCGFLLEHSDGG